MRYRILASFQGAPYEAGVGPDESDVVLFAACPPPESLRFEPATGHWRKRVSRTEVQTLYESRPVGMFRGERCIVLDDLTDRLHIVYLGHDALRAAQLGYWEVDRGVFELITPRHEVTDIVEQRRPLPIRSDSGQHSRPGPMPTDRSDDVGQSLSHSSGFDFDFGLGSSLDAGPGSTGLQDDPFSPDRLSPDQLGLDRLGSDAEYRPYVSSDLPMPGYSSDGQDQFGTASQPFDQRGSSLDRPSRPEPSVLRPGELRPGELRPGDQSGVAIPPIAEPPLPLEAQALRATSSAVRRGQKGSQSRQHTDARPARRPQPAIEPPVEPSADLAPPTAAPPTQPQPPPQPVNTSQPTAAAPTPVTATTLLRPTVTPPEPAATAPLPPTPAPPPQPAATAPLPPTPAPTAPPATTAPTAMALAQPVAVAPPPTVMPPTASVALAPTQPSAAPAIQPNAAPPQPAAAELPQPIVAPAVAPHSAEPQQLVTPAVPDRGADGQTQQQPTEISQPLPAPVKAPEMLSKAARLSHAAATAARQATTASRQPDGPKVTPAPAAEPASLSDPSLGQPSAQPAPAPAGSAAPIDIGPVLAGPAEANNTGPIPAVSTNTGPIPAVSAQTEPTHPVEHQPSEAQPEAEASPLVGISDPPGATPPASTSTVPSWTPQGPVQPQPQVGPDGSQPGPGQVGYYAPFGPDQPTPPNGTATVNGTASAVGFGVIEHMPVPQPQTAEIPALAAEPEADLANSTRRRRATKKRLPTQKIFSDLATQAAIPAAAYAIGEDVDGAMCLVRTDEGFEVFNASGGARHEVRVFQDEESAYFYLFGVLVAESVRTGALVPRD